MDGPHTLLFLWWASVPLTILGGFVAMAAHQRRQAQLDRFAVFAPRIDGVPAVRRKNPSSELVFLPFLILGLFAIFGTFAVSWLRNSSPMLLLNSYLVMLLYGTALMAAGLCRRCLGGANRFRLTPEGRRFIAVSFGALIVLIGGFWAASDFLFQRRIVEGFITGKATQTFLRGPAYTLVLENKQYGSLGDLYETLREGDFISASVSRTGRIMAAEKIASPR